MPRGKRIVYSREKLENCVKQSQSHQELVKLLGYTDNASKRVRRDINIYNIDISHFKREKKREVVSRNTKYSNLIGQKFGDILIKDIVIVAYTDRTREYRTTCECLNCGNIKEHPTRITNKNFGLITECKKCKNWTKDYVPQTKWNMIEWSAIDRDIEFKITKEFVTELFLKQNKKCALTGLLIQFGRVHYPEENTASLDRIDSNKDYTEDNVQWVHKKIQLMKMNLSQSEFIQFCKLIAEKFKDIDEISKSETDCKI